MESMVSYIEPSESFRYPWYMRIVFLLQRRRYGRELEPVRLWGRIPGAYLAMAALYRTLDRKTSRIEPELRSLVQVLVSRINWCEFCVDLNSHIGLERGIASKKFQDLTEFEHSPLFGDRERTALRYADAVTRGKPPDAGLVSGLHQHFDDQAIVELAALIAYQNMSSKFNAALGVPAQGFCAAATPIEVRH